LTRYNEVLKQNREQQGQEKPFISYTRNQSWNGQPCDACGSKEGIHEVGGRYVAGSSETNDLMYLCGNCVEHHLEKDFDAMCE
jgi:hypothetical protein